LLRFETTAKMLQNRVQISRFLTPAKITGGMGEILAVRYRVRPRPMWCNLYDALLGSLGD